MRGFVDIHSHFIYGLDDGAKTRREMETMLDAAHADGVVSLFATPHITPGVKPFDEAAYVSRLREARRYCMERGYGMQLFSGAEILYTPVLPQYAGEHGLPTLGNSSFVLLEFVPQVELRELEAALALMKRGGYTPILAHIERYACLYRGRTAAKLKQRFEVCYQLNANTILTKQGFFRTRKIRSWLKAGLVDFVASDAHDLNRRSTKMRRAFRVLEQQYDQRLAERLTGLSQAGRWGMERP